MNNTNTTTSPNLFQMGTLNVGGTPNANLNSRPVGVATAPINAPQTMPQMPVGTTPIAPTNIPQSQNIATFGTQPINIPGQNIPQPSTIASQADRILQETAVADTEAQKMDKSLAQTIFDIAPQLAGKTQEKYNAVQTATGALKQRQQDINAQIYQKNAEIQKDDIQLASDLDRLEGGGILKSIVNTQKYDVARKAQITRSLKMADANMLNAQSLALNGQIELAKQTAEDAVNAKYSVFEDILNTTKLQREALQPILTADEKKQARQQDIKTNLLLNDLKLQKENEQKANDMIINAMPFAPQSVTAAAQKVISQGGNLVQVAQALGKYAGDFLGNQLKLSSIRENEMQIAKIANDIKQSQTTLPNNAPVGSTNYSITSWTNSAKNKNSLTAEERGGVSKAFSVVNQIGALNENLKKDQTSFFGGNVKKIMASLGQNTDAGTVQAQITALVPQVAKGIYGEVGVLTDQDTARYTQTLPNLTSPEKQNDAVTALTLTALRNGVKSKLDVAAASNLDVSGFVPLYQDLTSKINAINDRTGVNDVRVGEIVKTNPQTKPLVETLIKQGKKGSEILQVLGAE
jgi:hypothetical protein